MTSPYTALPLDALMAAQTSVGMTLTALLLFKPLRPIGSTWLLLAAIWAAILLPVGLDFMKGLDLPNDPGYASYVLGGSAALATGAMILARRPWLAVTAAVGELGLFFVTATVTESGFEIAAAHLAFFGFLIGCHWRSVDSAASSPLPPPPPRSYLHDDIALFVVAVLAGALVSWVVLGLHTNSGDEWANTFQAAVFAKGQAYAEARPCASAFQAFWVFQSEGRLFSQYTPGWPFFMTPFVALGVPWLAGPFSFGFLVTGAARLGRRAAIGFAPGPRVTRDSLIRAAGIFSAIAVLLGSTMLINAGSRYPHVFVAATFAWSVEALAVIATPGLRKPLQRWWGLVLGTAAALMISARPADGAFLGIGLAVYFTYALVRRYIGWQAAAFATLGFWLWGGLTLVVLRLQLGSWFVTGYSLNPIIHTWNRFEYSVPKPNEWKWGIPLATGSYCWWPCAPAVGLAGLAALRGRARAMWTIFAFGYVPYLAYYTFLEVGRGADHAYGPRYAFVCVVAMSTGTGPLLATLWDTARRKVHAHSALRAGGATALALAALVLGVVRIAPLIYPYNHMELRIHNRFRDMLEQSSIHDAVIFVGKGITNTDPMDLTENLPLDLYPDQDVIVAIDRSPELVQCVRDLYPTRSFFRAVPGREMSIEPID